VLLALLAATVVRARLTSVAIAIALAFDAFFPHAELVAVAIVVALAGADTPLLLANGAGAAIPVALAFNALLVVTDLVAGTVVVVSAPGQRAVSQRGEPRETEHTTGGGLEHAATSGLPSQDASHVIEPTIVHERSSLSTIR
jgi:hypothetical protein